MAHRWSSSLQLAIPLLGLALLVGCSPNAESIRRANAEAQATATAQGIAPDEHLLSDSDSESISARISVFDLRPGDCFDWADEEDEIEIVITVPCASQWEARVLTNLPIPDGPFPGESHFGEMALAQCDRTHTYYLFPTTESWADGDRVLSCLQEREGFDLRLVGKLEAGECFTTTILEGFEYMYALQTCDGADWDMRVTDVIEVPDAQAFPGDAILENLAFLNCSELSDSYQTPSEISWSFGDRDIYCIEEH